jgi:hypothetical protein
MESLSASIQAPLRLGPGPFIFCGAPPQCAGDIDLINESDDKLSVRLIATVGPTEKKKTAPFATQLQVRVRLGPRERARARTYFPIDSRTPPGSYKLELVCGDQRVPVTAHVWEKASLKIEPRVIPLRGASGDVVKASIVISNEGNVTETFRGLALVYLEEHEWIGRAQVYALRKLKETGEDGILAFLDQLIAELKNTMPREARVVLRTQITELGPGETRDLEVEMTLPEGLHKGRTYFGFAKFMRGELKFKVDCNGASNSTIRRSR